MEREKLVLTKEEAKDIVYGDSEGYEEVENKIYTTTRWSEHHKIVVKRISDGKFFSDIYAQGKTESQDESPYDYSDPIFTEVFPVEKTIIVYE
jgi:hypothetical protein